MAQPYIGEIRMFAGNFAPSGWMLCEGQLLPISEYETLFTLIGTTYGGDGENTFALPDARGRVLVHQGSGYQLADKAGVETVTLNAQQIANHSHVVNASRDDADQITANNGVLASPPSLSPYFASTPDAALNAGQVATAGGNQPHNNLQRYLCVNFIISMFGIFPPQP